MFKLALALAFGVVNTAFAKPLTERILNTSVIVRVGVESVGLDGKKQTGLASCSGTYIGPTEVLTAGHCFPGSRPGKIWVRGTDGVSHAAKVVNYMPELDLALLLVDGPNHVYARMGKGVRAGETVFSVGSPMRLEFLVSDGVVQAVDKRFPPFKGFYVLHGSMINPGSSGGGVFNKRGELVGVNTMSIGGLFGWSGISAAVDVDTINSFLAGVL